MTDPLRILILEDNPADVELVQFELEEAGIVFTAKAVSTEKDFVRALAECSFDLILSDYDLPGYNGNLALEESKKRCPDIPFVLVTGAVTEDRAIKTLTNGAKDYVMKSRLQQRLAPAVRRVVAEAEEIRARKRAEEELRKAHAGLEVKVRERTAALEAEIAQRKRAEEALQRLNEQLEQRVAERTAEVAHEARKVRAERQRFLDMLDTLPVILDIIREDHRIEWANRAFREALGDNVGRLCYEGQFGRRTPCEECQAFTPLRTGRPHHWEWTLPNGRTFDIHNFPFAAADGSPAVLEMDLDITEKRQAEAVREDLNATLERQVAERTGALRESEDRYRGVVEKTTAIILRVDPGGVITFANRRALDFFGYSAGELIGSHVVGTVVPPRESSGRDLAAMVEQIAADPDAFHTNANENLCRDGRVVWVEWTNSGIYGPDGRLKEFLSVGIDATERRLAEKTLLESEARYRQLFDHMLDGFAYCRMLYDERGKPQDFVYLAVNEAFGQLTGLKDVIGKRVTEVIPRIRESAPELFEIYGRVARTGRAERFEINFTPLGLYLAVAVYGPAEGHFGAVFDDITERKRLEEAARLQNRILDGINRIFRMAIACETKEDLGGLGLEVVQELTGSQIGFIGEIGPDGLLHDIAISNPGWDACTMIDRTGHRRPPGDFKVHGIYGRVLTEAKSLIVNDPASHPDRIGIPAGHPPLAAFLGVPLLQGGSTVGMIAVGNRPGGYTEEQQRTLEALGPAILEALSRKEAEETLRDKAERRKTPGTRRPDGSTPGPCRAIFHLSLPISLLGASAGRSA